MSHEEGDSSAGLVLYDEKFVYTLSKIKLTWF